jgi:hypothetical protein
MVTAPEWRIADVRKGVVKMQRVLISVLGAVVLLAAVSGLSVPNQPDPAVPNQPDPAVPNRPDPAVPNRPDPAVPNQPDPGQCDGELRIGVSPKNDSVTDLVYQHVYVFTLRDSTGTPIGGYPASQVELDFSGCTEPSTRPQDEIPADGPSSASGNITWLSNLTFGGSDSCSVLVLVQNVSFFTIPGYGMIPEGGLRSPDNSGDGFVALSDLSIWQQAFIGSAPIYEGDVAEPHDDLVALSDLSWWQAHFIAP